MRLQRLPASQDVARAMFLHIFAWGRVGLVCPGQAKMQPGLCFLQYLLGVGCRECAKTYVSDILWGLVCPGQAKMQPGLCFCSICLGPGAIDL